MYPSKSDGMFVPESLIFRSDSNGEDLEGYAGAGLYDSITMDRTELRKVDYASDRSAPPLPVLLLFWASCGASRQKQRLRLACSQHMDARVYGRNLLTNNGKTSFAPR